MTEGHRRDVRTIDATVAGIAIVSGIGVVLAGPSPTGSTIVDVILLLAAVGLCVFTIATAPWTSRWRRTRWPVITAVAVGIALQVLSRLGNLWHFGFSAGLAVALVLIAALVAIQRRSGRRRLQLWSAFGGIVVAGILALLGFGVAAAAARPNLTKGADEAKVALKSLKAGNFDEARQGFQLAANLLHGASDDLDQPWAQAARLIPVVAQHRRAASELAKSAEGVSNSIADVLGEIDFDRLRVVNGVIDINAITALQAPLARLNKALDDLHSTVESIDNQWLVNPIRTRLATLSNEIDDQQVEGDRATLAVQRVPDMLGANRKRVYFIAFTTPAESRGLGGFMGNWAEVTIDKGHISVTNFGRTADLAVDGDTEHWVRITSSPHFPDVAKLIADGYPAFGGHPVDGVFAMDVYTVAALMKLTGPIDLTTIAQTVSADNVAKFLLSDQYAAVQDRAERIDLLEEVARTTISRLLTSSLPAPPDLIKLLSPFSAQGRLDFWSSHPEEEDVIERVRMSGELPVLDGSDGLAVVINNVGNNKIDYYLTGETAYSVTTDPASGKVSATLDITLHNNAPEGVTEPAIVFTNSEGAPPGTNVMQLNVYSALPVTGITVNSASREADATSTSHGYNVSRLDLQIAPQSTLTIQLQLAGELDLSDGYHLSIRNGASVSPLDTTLVVDRSIAEDLGSVAGVREIGARNG